MIESNGGGGGELNPPSKGGPECGATGLVGLQDFASRGPGRQGLRAASRHGLSSLATG